MGEERIMPKIPVTFDDVKTLAERSKTKTLGDSDLIAVEIAQEIKGLTKEDALETLGINDLEGRVDTVEGEIDDLQTAETDIKGNGWTDENLVDHESRITQNESDIVALKGSGWAGQTVKQNADDIATKESIENVNTLKGTGWTDETVKGNADDIAILNGDDSTEGSVLKSIKDNAENATFTPAVASGIESETLEEAVNEVGNLLNSERTRLTSLEGKVTSLENPTTAMSNLEDTDVILVNDVSESKVKKITKTNFKEDLGINQNIQDIVTLDGRVQYLEETGGPPGPQGDDGLSAYEIAVKEGFSGTELEWLESLEGKSAYEYAVEEGFVGDETAWLASLKGADGDSAYDVAVSEGFSGTEQEWLESLKGADGDDGLSAYEIYVETTSDSPVKTEEQWLASLKGADGKSAYEYAEEEGYEGTEGEFAEALADVENKIDKSKIVTAWTSPKNDEVPSASLVHNSLNTLEAYFVKDVVIIGSASHVSAGLAGESWEEITADNEAWISFWAGVLLLETSVRFLKGEYEIPTNIYFGENGDGRFAIPCGVAKIEGAGEDTVIKVGYPAGGTAFLSATKHDGSKSAPCHISNLKIVNTGTTTFGIVFPSSISGEVASSVVENVIIEDMVAVGIACSTNNKEITIRNCTLRNCGSASAGQNASGIAVATSGGGDAPSNIVIDGCTVIGGAYAGIGLVGAEDCKVVNCHVEDYGAIGAGAIGGERNIFANNTIIRDTQANPQSGEFGLLLNETDRAIVTGNIVENAHIMNNDSDDCVIENNIGDVL
jgi:hypothetical protein